MIDYMNNLLKSIDSVLIGGNHLANVLINNGITKPQEIACADEIEDILLRDVFIAWRAIMDLNNFTGDNRFSVYEVDSQGFLTIDGRPKQ